MSEVALSVNSINKSFKNNQILDDINLDIKKGEIFGLIGVNGAGKTTLIKIILDLLKNTSGNIKIFNKLNIHKNSRENISYLPEKFHPSYYLKGHEFLSLTMGFFKKKYNKETALSYANKLDLQQSALNKKVSKYSKGMGQKLGLMSVFMSESPLLILDEPMSGLDPHVRIQLKNMLKEYVAKKNTVFFSSHILSDIDEICNRIAVLHNSKIIFTGTAAGFKKQYKGKTLEEAFLKAIKK